MYRDRRMGLGLGTTRGGGPGLAWVWARSSTTGSGHWAGHWAGPSQSHGHSPWPLCLGRPSLDPRTSFKKMHPAPVAACFAPSLRVFSYSDAPAPPATHLLVLLHGLGTHLERAASASGVEGRPKAGSGLWCSARPPCLSPASLLRARARQGRAYGAQTGLPASLLSLLLRPAPCLSPARPLPLSC